MKLNTIHNEDCLEGMKRVSDDFINLIYIDPPFCTQKNRGYKDAWKWDKEIKTYYGDIKHHQATKAFEILLGKNGLMAYLIYMYIRIKEMRRVLAEDGSIYVHLDWHIGHYVKVMMDEIFGMENFRNEIVWRYRRWPAPSNDFQRMHDVILRYSKSENTVWNQLYEERAPSTLKAFGDRRIISTRKETGEKVLRATEEKTLGVNMSDVWEISYIQGSASDERAQGGYFTTQKPEALLKRIILASSNPGDLVADFFCGSGTTLAVAEKLGRHYIGFEINPEYYKIARKRLSEVQLELIK